MLFALWSRPTIIPTHRKLFPMLARQFRGLRVKARSAIDSLDVWHEGTLGHIPEAIEDFEFYLDGLRKEPEWFGESGTGSQTWFVDTGDATTFGDPISLR